MFLLKKISGQSKENLIKMSSGEIDNFVIEKRYKKKKRTLYCGRRQMLMLLEIVLET